MLLLRKRCTPKILRQYNSIKPISVEAPQRNPTVLILLTVPTASQKFLLPGTSLVGCNARGLTDTTPLFITGEICALSVRGGYRQQDMISLSTQGFYLFSLSYSQSVVRLTAASLRCGMGRRYCSVDELQLERRILQALKTSLGLPHTSPARH